MSLENTRATLISDGFVAPRGRGRAPVYTPPADTIVRFVCSSSQKQVLSCLCFLTHWGSRAPRDSASQGGSHALAVSFAFSSGARGVQLHGAPVLRSAPNLPKSRGQERPLRTVLGVGGHFGPGGKGLRHCFWKGYWVGLAPRRSSSGEKVIIRGSRGSVLLGTL